MRKIIKVIDCSNENFTPEEAIQEIKYALIDKCIGFQDVFYEVKSKKGYAWVNSLSEKQLIVA